MREKAVTLLWVYSHGRKKIWFRRYNERNTSSWDLSFFFLPSSIKKGNRQCALADRSMDFSLALSLDSQDWTILFTYSNFLSFLLFCCIEMKYRNIESKQFYNRLVSLFHKEKKESGIICDNHLLHYPFSSRKRQQLRCIVNISVVNHFHCLCNSFTSLVWIIYRARFRSFVTGDGVGKGGYHVGKYETSTKDETSRNRRTVVGKTMPHGTLT